MEELGICQFCHTAPAVCVMEKIVTDDQERSDGPGERYKRACPDCAWDAFEAGEWERDE